MTSEAASANANCSLGAFTVSANTRMPPNDYVLVMSYHVEPSLDTSMVSFAASRSLYARLPNVNVPPNLVPTNVKLLM